MKWRHWAILIVLVLLNYILFSIALTKLAEQRQPGPRFTRTPQPTFTRAEPTPMAWIVLPTSTALPTRTPFTPLPTEQIPTASATVQITLTPTAGPTATDTPSPTATPAVSTPQPPTATPSAQMVSHKVKRGETLSEIAAAYGVTIQAIVEANGLADPGYIITGQVLIIPAPGQKPPPVTPQATARPAASKTPTPRPTPRPATATPKPTAASLQFTAEVIWDPLVAPNCRGPAIAKQSVIKDTAGNPVDGVRVEVNCYGNAMTSHLSGTPGEYESGHYDWSPGQTTPQDWICTARVVEFNGQPVTSSEVVSIHFDTNDCQPYGIGHQVAIVNWTKHW